MHILAWVVSSAALSTVCCTLISRQYQAQNGTSSLGTLDNPPLPEYVEGPLSNGFPWGKKSAFNTDPLDAPNTGVTRFYNWTLTNGTVAPDGIPVSNILLVNGQFPGPMIEANWGDWIEVHFTNAFEGEGASLHWHGLPMRHSQWNDGVPGVTACPIAPGSSFTYRYRAQQYGTSWWHSHYSQQYIAGVHGPIVIHGPKHVDYDIDLGPVMLGEWFHHDYTTMVDIIMARFPVGSFNVSGLTPDSILINGKMGYNCSVNFRATGQACASDTGLAKFKFVSGKKHLLRLINTSVTAYQKFSIDGHNMTMVAMDFVPIKPHNTSILSIGVGQRVDVIVEGTGEPGDTAWMRTVISPNCSVSTQHMSSFGIIYYESAPTKGVPNTSSLATPQQIDSCFTEDLAPFVPIYAMKPDPNPSLTIRLDITMKNNGTSNIWYINNSTYRGDYNDPNLLEAKLGKNHFSPSNNIYHTGQHSSVRLVVYNYMVKGVHPMHLHGHNMYVLDTGFGEWDGKSGVLNNSNPIRRDTQILGQGHSNASTIPANDFLGTPSYIVVQYEQDNPGVWPFHCHVAWHASDGLIVSMFERPKDVKKIMIPMTAAQTCRDWSAWTGKNVVDVIDSGL